MFINGSSCLEVFLIKKDCQANPISPFLFMLVSESLISMFTKDANVRWLGGLKVNQSGIMISHLQICRWHFCFFLMQVPTKISISSIILFYIYICLWIKSWIQQKRTTLLLEMHIICSNLLFFDVSLLSFWIFIWVLH